MSRGGGQRVCLGLGSNLGGRLDYLRRAVAAVAAWPDTSVKAVSSVYETDPVGPQDQNQFLNAAAVLSTAAEPVDFLDRLLALELDLDRVRTRHWGPRTIDLDLLLWDDRIVNTDKLSLPHPEMPNRAFVLVPLAEIAAGLKHPVMGQSVAELASVIDDSGVHIYQKGAGWSGLSL